MSSASSFNFWRTLCMDVKLINTELSFLGLALSADFACPFFLFLPELDNMHVPFLHQSSVLHPIPKVKGV